jgi:UDP:flavonoid glycosyltransferase YjiC (YdhE family)
MQQSGCVGFFVWGQRGHIYPTLHLAKVLRRRGIEVCYFGFEDGAAIVREQGFAYVMVASGEEKRTSLEPSGRLGDEDAEQRFEAITHRFADQLRALRVSHLFVDPLYHQAAVAALSAGVQASYVWTLNPQYFRDRHLPHGWSYRTLWVLGRRAPWVLWVLAYGRDRFGTARTAILQRRRPVASRVLRQASRRFALPLAYTSLGYMLDLPAIVLGPEGFDDSRSPNLAYLGLGIDESRVERAWEPQPARRLIYCSLGTNFTIYTGAQAVIEQTLRAAEQMPDLDFFVQLPSGGWWPSDVPRNVTLWRGAGPTLAVLKRASAAVMHGGYGTLKECIWYSVPMLVVPFMYDQPGNAMRVRQNGLGLVELPGRIRADRLRAMLRRLLDDGAFRDAVVRLRARMIERDRYGTFCEQLAGMRRDPRERSGVADCREDGEGWLRRRAEAPPVTQPQDARA